jgi:hypothetical protein
MTVNAASAWDRYWFATSTKYHYGIFRLLFVSGFFLLPVGSVRFANLPALADQALDRAFLQPTALVRLLHLPVPAPGWLFPVTVVVACLAAAGVATRCSLVMLAGLNLYLGSALNSYGFIAHDTTLPSLFLLVLAFAPGVSALSVDAFISARRRRDGQWIRLGAALPVWPVRLLLVVMAVAYFSAGYAKLREAGPEWATGRTLQAYITDPQPAPYLLADPDPSADDFRDGIGLGSFLYSSGRPTWIAQEFARSDATMAMFATVSLLWELTFPVVLVFRRALLWYLLLGLVFHVMVSVSFGLHSFYAYPLCYLVFVDWPRTLAWMRRAVDRIALPGRWNTGHAAGGE